MSVLNFFGIYPDEIEQVAEVFEKTLEKEGLSVREIDDEWDAVMQTMQETLADADFNQTTITNVIMYATYDVLKAVIEERHPEKEASYFINGCDTHFYIDNEEQYG